MDSIVTGRSQIAQRLIERLMDKYSKQRSPINTIFYKTKQWLSIRNPGFTCLDTD